MDKGHTHTHIHTLLLIHKKEWNNAICSNMDGPRDYHTKWIQTKTNITCYHLYVESKNKNKDTKWAYLQNRNIPTNRRQIFLSPKKKGKDKLGVCDQHINTTIYIYDRLPRPMV